MHEEELIAVRSFVDDDAAKMASLMIEMGAFYGEIVSSYSDMAASIIRHARTTDTIVGQKG